MKKVQEMVHEEEKLRIPVAQGLPWTTDEPEVRPLIQIYGGKSPFNSLVRFKLFLILSWPLKLNAKKKCLIGIFDALLEFCYDNNENAQMFCANEISYSGFVFELLNCFSVYSHGY